MTGRLLTARQVAPVERYVDARELAELMGVSTRTIARMVAEGMPSETWGMSRTRRYLPSKAMAWAQERVRMSEEPGRNITPPGQHNRRE